VLVECEISIESHSQSFNFIGQGNLGASDSRCRNGREVVKTLSGAKQNGLGFAGIKCKAVVTVPVMYSRQTRGETS